MENDIEVAFSEFKKQMKSKSKNHLIKVIFVLMLYLHKRGLKDDYRKFAGGEKYEEPKKEEEIKL